MLFHRCAVLCLLHGHNLYIAYADEGHPYFIFYRTDKFMNDEAATLAQTSVYKVDSIEAFDDEGNITYTISECFDEDPEGESTNAKKVQCEFHYNILMNKP